MSWIEPAIDNASQPIEIDVKDLCMGVDTLSVIPLSATEYQALKAHPDAIRISGDDKNEYLGMRMVYEMLHKCDNNLKWGQFQQLPIQLLGAISTRVTDAIGDLGGGALGEA